MNNYEKKNMEHTNNYEKIIGDMNNYEHIVVCFLIMHGYCYVSTFKGK